MPDATPADDGVAASLPERADVAALRERGATRFDPVRFRLIESMARRVGAHEGATRRMLDARLAALVAAFGGELERADENAPDTTPRIDAAPPKRGPLAALVEHVARQAPPPAKDAATSAPTTAASRGTPADLKTVQYFRRTWSRLSADQRLAQSLSTQPENAGPLNSQHLVHRALTAMRDLSPEYLDRFVAQVDALLWIEQAIEADERDVMPAPARGGGTRRAARGR